MIPFEYSHVKLEYFRTDHYYHSDIPQVRQMFSSVNTTWKMKTVDFPELTGSACILFKSIA